jgi:uncharacterized protein YndB with AHSA1/START domain
MKNNTEITKDLANKKLNVVRHFNAPVSKVWKAWTESELLDKWWAPRPWRAETKSMDFKEGGLWLYAMAGPEGEKHWSRVDFKSINPQKSFATAHAFCDEDGNLSNIMATSYWDVTFSDTETGSKVDVTLTFDTEVDMQTLVQMGFEGGFTMALGNLDELLEA